MLATSVDEKKRTRPVPSACVWKNDSPASVAKTAWSRMVSSYSAEPVSPCGPGFATTRDAAQPAVAAPSRRVAQTWDLARAAAAQPTTTYVDPTTGRRHSTMWLVPRSAEDLGARRRVHRLWAEPSYGLMGRTPDHVACVLSAFAGWRQLFDRGGTHFGDNVVRFYERARDEDLYVAYGIVPLQIDRSQP